MTISQALNISRESLNNYQQALVVVSQNIANMNVDGYIKLRADFATNPVYNYGSSVEATVLGLNGAKISQITSYANQQAANGAREANCNLEYYSELSDLMSRLSGISDELGENGLSADFSAFFSAAQNLSANPTDPSARTLYIQSAQNVADKFNYVAKSLDSLQEELVGNYNEPSTITSSTLYTDITAFNSGLEQLAEINKQLLLAGGSGATNSLINDREKLLNNLSNYADFTVVQNPNGTINLAVGNTSLVAGAKQVAKLEAVTGDAETPAVIQIKAMNDTVIYENVNSDVKGGKIGAILDTVNTKEGFISINAMRNEINTLAATFADEVNGVQLYSNGDIKAMALGVDANGNTILVEAKEPIFNIGNPPSASNISINKKVLDDVSLIAAARVDTSAQDWEKNVGNSDNAIAFSQLRDKTTMATTGSSAMNTTFEGFLTFFSTTLGMQEQDIAQKMSTADAINQATQTELQSLNGVNLDEELSDMLKYQRGYEASARLFSVADEIYDILVNLGA